MNIYPPHQHQHIRMMLWPPSRQPAQDLNNDAGNLIARLPQRIMVARGREFKDVHTRRHRGLQRLPHPLELSIWHQGIVTTLDERHFPVVPAPFADPVLDIHGTDLEPRLLVVAKGLARKGLVLGDPARVLPPDL